MVNGIFITGTDTDAGKTVVTAGLLRSLRKGGVNAASMKPVMTGGIRRNGRLASIDLDAHHAAAGMSVSDEEYGLMCPYCYEPECSPHLAGRMAGRYADFDTIAACFEELSHRYDTVLVEGAGGVHAPIDETQTMLDLMKRLGLPVLIVARRGLGTINHSLLSIKAIRDAGLDLLGVVFNETENVKQDFIRKDNPGAVESFGKVRILGNVDYLTRLQSSPNAAWKKFDACVPGLLELFSEVKTP